MPRLLEYPFRSCWMARMAACLTASGTGIGLADGQVDRVDDVAGALEDLADLGFLDGFGAAARRAGMFMEGG